MTDLDLNNILDVKRRSRAAKAVQFTGTNGREVVAFLKEYGLDNVEKIRNGGRYVRVDLYGGEELTLRKGEYAVVDADKGVLFLDGATFEYFFSYKR